ncbi:MAG: tetratricopeptide repeat protein [Planctomycetota bacterium]
MMDASAEKLNVRLGRLAIQIAVALAFLVAFEWGARAAGRWIDESPEGKTSGNNNKPWYAAALEFTKDPARRPDPYLGFAGTSPLFIKINDRDGNEIYTVAPNKVGTYRNDVYFLAQKPKDSIRIFCIGGSSVASAGIPAPGTFPSLLAYGLRAIYGNRQIEVINCGGGGTGSFQYREIAREVCNYDADLIVVYPEAGERRYLPPQPESELAARDMSSPARAETRRLLVKSRLYLGFRDLIEALRPDTQKAMANVTFSLIAIDAARRQFSDETFTRVFDFKKDRMPPAMAPVLSSEEITKAHRHFIANLTAIAEESRASGVPVLFVDSIRNLKNDFYLRFHVEPRDVDPAKAESWKKHYRAGIEFKKNGKLNEAIAEFYRARECYKIDRDEILSLYIGQCLEAQGRYEKARQEYERFFLIHPLKLKLQEVANSTNTALIDPYPALLRKSPNGIPAETYFMDSFHPMPAGNAIIAEEILQAIFDKNLFVKTDAPRAPIIEGAKQQIASIADKVDIFANRKIQIAVNNGNYKDAVEFAKNLAPHEKNYVSLMYLGYAYAKLGERDAARETWLMLKRELFGSGGGVSISMPRLDSDSDIVKHLFDGDLFSEF